MSACPDRLISLSRHIDWSLTAPEEADLAEHLRGCSGCREALRWMEVAHAGLRSLGQASGDPRVAESIVDRLAQAGLVGGRGRSPRRIRPALVVGFGVVALLVLIALRAQRGPPEDPREVAVNSSFRRSEPEVATDGSVRSRNIAAVPDDVFQHCEISMSELWEGPRLALARAERRTPPVALKNTAQRRRGETSKHLSYVTKDCNNQELILAEIKQATTKNSKVLAACLQEEVQRNPDVKQIEVGLLLVSSGEVSSVSAVSVNGEARSAAAECLLERMKQTPFSRSNCLFSYAVLHIVLK